MEKLKKIERLYGILVVTGAILVVVSVCILDFLGLAFVGIILACVGMFIVAPQAKCPFCGGHLRLKFGLPGICPYCKKSLKDEES